MSTPSSNSHVQVAYVEAAANGGGQYLVDVILEPGMSCMQVLQASGLLLKLPKGQALLVGVFSHRIDVDSYQPQDGDRFEIYRALTRDPKEVRRKRADANPVGKRKARVNEKYSSDAAHASNRCEQP